MSRPDVDASASRSLTDSFSSRGRAIAAATLPTRLAAPDAGCPLVTAPGATRSRPETEPRYLAARLLERTLLRLGRAGIVVERRLAPALARMHGRRLYRLLGFVRLADYLTERLGTSLRRGQSILRLERALASFPRMARALEAGEVSVSKLEIAAGAATTETEAAWLERAKRLSLTRLREIARQESAAPAASSPTESSAAESSATAAPTSDLPIEQDEPGRLITFQAPGSVVAIWHWTLDLVRRVAGRQEPAWRCAEYLAAEFLSGVPDVSGESPPGPLDDSTGLSPSAPNSPTRAPDPCSPATAESLHASEWPDPDEANTVGAFGSANPEPGLPARDAPGMAAWIEAAAAVREALASIGASADPEEILSERPTPVGPSDPALTDQDAELDAWELDARLRRIVRLRQSLAWRQGHLLATFVSLRLHRELGFDTLDDWVGERLAMSPRRARYLVSLARRLRDLPLLADAYRRGLVSWCQARLLVRVVRPTTQSRWIRYAREVTVRRLEDVIVDCEVNAAADHHPAPDPLPPTDPLPPFEPLPGETASLPFAQALRHTSAPVGSAPAHASPLLESAPLHTSAPVGCAPPRTSAPPLAPDPLSMTSRDPRPTRRISFWCPLAVASLWDSALRACRAAAGVHLEDWECFLLLVRSMRETWENQEDPHWRRRYNIFERDGWRCKTPGCTSRSGLNEHHIVFRSQQGNDDAANLVTLCVGHHQQGLHEGHIRCFGKAPDGLWWDIGVKPGGQPLARYFGDRMVTRRPFVPAEPHTRRAATTARARAG